MKIAAAVLSWIGGVLTIVIMWSSFGPLLGYELAFLAIPLVFTFITIAVLIYRQWATNHGSKVLAGILTIIFCGLLGGIFTLCIPESDLCGMESVAVLALQENHRVGGRGSLADNREKVNDLLHER